MIVYHVCSSNKIKKYLKSKQINSPVKAWENLKQAERMSKSTGRRFIIRLKFPDNASKLEGHYNQARVIYQNYKLVNF